MRTTVTLDPDVSAEVERLCRADGVGVSEAVNRLIRRALAARPEPRAYRHPSVDLGLSVDISHICDVVDMLDEPAG